MAFGFGSTNGTGDTDYVQSTLTAQPSTRSYWCRVWRTGNGGGSFARLFGTVDGNFSVSDFDSQNITLVNQVRSVGPQQWSITRLATGSWHAFGLAYQEDTSIAAYLNGTKLTVGSGMSIFNGGSGTLTSPNGSPTTIGNSAATNRVWNGRLCDYAQWNAVLNDNEFAALHKGHSPLRIRPTALVEYIPMVRDPVSLVRSAPSITGAPLPLAHPPIIIPR